ncbi:GON-4-like protein isoform X2 [Myripristis murdjan]|uniref:GON-4-like protein isoform X2 n=1 Tax=Myripristis murdjan TaxID=586833 RepID=UPI001175DA1C|nr:GON-4-like protein isoform X2 [Myripristis murdjan]
MLLKGHYTKTERSCFSTMNSARKRLRLSPSKSGRTHPPAATTHDALLPTTEAEGALQEEEEEEEEEGYLLVEEDTTDSSLVITMEEPRPEGRGMRRRAGLKRKKKLTEEEEEESEEEEEEEAGVEVEIDRQLDQSLETKSKQHNLTSVNVKNIIHEVITNEHVVAMMKAAINETEAVPPFEPKMTRSKLKEVVEKGVVIPAWSISPIKKSSDMNKGPQFVDIPLADEDSSDEEYRPDEEDEDETAEDTFQESDMESTASSPRGSRVCRVDEDSWSPWQSSRHRSRRQRAGSVSMGPPPPPQAPPPKAVTDSTFLEKLHAVEEELAVCMEPYQPLSGDDMGLMAYRTRSKRPLRDVPLGRLEAELRAPDITPDMYDSGSAHEDRDWTDWLRGLMSSDVENEEECDDEDDPEYNFLADIDEPDLEDYRDDKAVRITKKEVNELMEELFETLKEDLAGQDLDDEGHEEEEEQQEETQAVHTHIPQETIVFAKAVEEPGAGPGPGAELRTVRQQLAWLQRRQRPSVSTQTQQHTPAESPEPYTLRLDGRQKARLQQQLQQHVQLLAQIHLLSRPVARLHGEAETTRQFLFELDLLAQRAELLAAVDRPGFSSAFRASNLQGALQLLEEQQQNPVPYRPQYHEPDGLGRVRHYPVMPAELAWLFATRPVFLHPELLPCCSLDPQLYCPRRSSTFTAAEDSLLVLGLRNMEGVCDPAKMVSQFLLRKTLIQIRRRILQCCRPGTPDNIIKAYRYQRVVWPMPLACGRVAPADQRPPVEREERLLPAWLARSLPVIDVAVRQFSDPCGPAPRPVAPAPPGRSRRCSRSLLRSNRKCSFAAGTRFPPRLPARLQLQRMGFVFVQPPAPAADPAPTADPDPAPDDTHDPASSSRPPASPAPPVSSSSSAAAPPPDPSAPLLQITQNPPHVLLHRLLLSHDGSVTMTSTRERISRHARMFATLRRRPWLPWLPPPPGPGEKASDTPPPPSPPPQPPLPSEDKSTQTRSLRRRRRRRRGGREHEGGGDKATPHEAPPPCQLEGVTLVVVKEEEEEEEGGEEEEEEEEGGGDVHMPLLALSESSPSAAGSDREAEPQQEVTPPPSRRGGEEDDDEDGGTSSESTLSVPELQETMEKLSWLASEGTEEEEEPTRRHDDNDDDDSDEGSHREVEDLAFAQDYLHRVCDAVQVSPSRAVWLLQVLERFSVGGAWRGRGLASLFGELSGVLQPWPQLLRDFAAFLSAEQAELCGLLAEQQQFERSRRFLQRLGRSLGEGSSHYQEVVSVLQGSSAPGPHDIEKISFLLRDHAHLREEFWEFFHHLHLRPSPAATGADITDADSISHNPELAPEESDSRTGSDGEEEEEEGGGGAYQPVCAKNISLTSTGQKVVLWTREADRAILTACQQRGANQSTFQLVSAQLGNKTARQVGSRFLDLMRLFRSTSCPADGQPISRQEAAPD